MRREKRAQGELQVNGCAQQASGGEGKLLNPGSQFNLHLRIWI
jgi:hypothetical protein